VDRLHHPLEDRVEQPARLFRIAVGQQLQRALQVGEQDGDLLALAFEGALRGEDPLGEVPGGIGLGGRRGCLRRGWPSRQRLAALAAELLAERVRRSTGGTAGLKPCSALPAELLPRGILLLAARTLHVGLRRATADG
jgi:hypothetical protein